MPSSRFASFPPAIGKLAIRRLSVEELEIGRLTIREDLSEGNR
jgi:hypothetical protein